LRISSKHKLDPVSVAGRTVIPRITLASVRPPKGAMLSYGADIQKRMSGLREGRVFDKLSNNPQCNYAGDVLRNTSITYDEWFDRGNSALQMFSAETAKHQDKSILSTNAGNAPLHDFEINFDAGQPCPTASKDFEMSPFQFAETNFFCLSCGPASGIDIGYVRFTDEGVPADRDIQVAVGGRPLVSAGRQTSLGEVLLTSRTDPRHVLNLPEMDIGGSDGRFMPLGIRTIQGYLKDIRSAEAIADKVRKDNPILINLALEMECCGISSESEFSSLAEHFLALNGYGKKDYALTNGMLYLKMRFNSYRHAFWAKRGPELFAGIIWNEYPKPARENYMEERVIKPEGLKIEELQNFLTKKLKADSAVLMGNGKDPRIYYSQAPHTASIVTHKDNDARDDITAGIVSLVF
jgi:hypothetical protein